MTRRRAPRPPRAPITRTCQNPKCPRGRTFQTHRPDQLFCSLQCRQAFKARARHRRRQDRLAELEAKLAELEGKPSDEVQHDEG
jgi:hypothetical protein